MPNTETLPILSTKEFVYVRLKAIIWRTGGLGLTDNLTGTIGTELTTLVASNAKGRLFIVNCSGVSSIDQQHGLAALKQHLAKAKDCILFVSDNPSFGEDLKDALGPPSVTCALGAERSGFGYGDGIAPATSLTRTVAKAFQFEKQETHRIVGSCFELHKGGVLKRLHSTPFRANGIFNARQLISNPQAFCLIATQLAECLEAIVQSHKPRRPVVLAVSLRGSPLAAAAAFLSNPRLEVEIVDHMGPKQAVLEGYSISAPRSQLDYIYVGDFLIGGTELKVAASYAGAHGCTLRHALIIGSLLGPEDYNVGASIARLVQLRDCCRNVNYKL